MYEHVEEFPDLGRKGIAEPYMVEVVEVVPEQVVQDQAANPYDVVDLVAVLVEDMVVAEVAIAASDLETDMKVLEADTDLEVAAAWASDHLEEHWLDGVVDVELPGSCWMVDDIHQMVENHVCHLCVSFCPLLRLYLC